MAPQARLERGFAVYRGSADPAARAALSLAAQAGVANAMPALLDEVGHTRYFLPDELTVQFRAGLTRERAERVVAEAGARILREQRTPGYYTLLVPEGRGLFETLRAFSALDDVLFAEPSEASFDDAFAHVPQDPAFANLWGLRNTGQRVRALRGIPGAHIDAPGAWEVTRGDPEVIAVVIDTGIELDHPDLAANILARGSEDWDFADTGDPSPDDQDVHSHGTHVAGTIAAAENGLGVVGVAPACRLLPLRVDLGRGMSQNRADAINYAVAHARAHPGRRYVLNCSWGISGDHAGVHTAITNAVAANVVVIFAAGNSGEDIDEVRQYPALYPETIAVAATNHLDRKCWFSNHGASVDVSAPGSNIYSTVRGGGYGYQEGTSMAAPHVAGVAALVCSANRSLTNRQVREVIEATCDDLAGANPAHVGRLGRGRVNAFRAVSAARAIGPRT
jgi:subtilisin family serine protease